MNYSHTLPDGRVQCDLCPRYCKLREGQRGFCFVRAREGKEVVLTTHGRSSGFCVDPIEKKPLNHFLPGTPVLSFGTAGCNLACSFCQNWDISKSREVHTLSDSADPEDIAATALKLRCRSVAFTYNDPVIFHEYAIDVARRCRAEGLKTVAVSAGYVCPAPRREFYRCMDAANIDLKAFSEEFYWRVTKSHLHPVLETLQYLKHETDVWLEITNLVIPGANDRDDEIRKMCDWIVSHLGNSVPLHFTAFHPDWRMRDRPPTPAATLLNARQIAFDSGIKFAYTGNIQDRASGSTWCPDCGSELIGREGYEIADWGLDSEGRCVRCNYQLEGVIESSPGTWGARRRPVRILGSV